VRVTRLLTPNQTRWASATSPTLLRRSLYKLDDNTLWKINQGPVDKIPLEDKERTGISQPHPLTPSPFEGEGEEKKTDNPLRHILRLLP